MCNHYGKFMTREEQLAERAHDMRMKAEGYGDCSVSSRLRNMVRMFAGEPGIAPLLAMSRDEFRRGVRDRLLREHRDEIDLNCCSACGRIPRSPEARQCSWCYHQWHEQRAT